MLWDMIALRCLTKECVLLLENVFSYYALGHDRSSLPCLSEASTRRRSTLREGEREGGTARAQERETLLANNLSLSLMLQHSDSLPVDAPTVPVGLIGDF